ERDEVDPLVIEGVVRLPERLDERLATVERRIVLAGEEAQRLDLERGDDLLELREPLTPLLRVVGRARQIAREDEEVGLRLHRVERRHRLLQRELGIGVRRSLETPVRIGEL